MQGFKKTRISRPGSAIQAWRIDPPEWWYRAVAEQLERGRAMRQQEKHMSKWGSFAKWAERIIAIWNTVKDLKGTKS